MAYPLPFNVASAEDAWLKAYPDRSRSVNSDATPWL